MCKSCDLTLTLRRQQMGRDAAGCARWETITERRTVVANQAALVLCDVWDRHWCRGADERLAALLARMTRVTQRTGDPVHSW